MALKNRKDMDPRFQWKLSDIFETPEAWEAAYAKAKKAVEELGTLEGTLKQSAESLKSGLDQIYGRHRAGGAGLSLCKPLQVRRQRRPRGAAAGGPGHEPVWWRCPRR